MSLSKAILIVISILIIEPPLMAGGSAARYNKWIGRISDTSQSKSVRKVFWDSLTNPLCQGELSDTVARSLLAYTIEFKCDSGKSYCLTLLGVDFSQKGNYQQSLDLLFKSLNISKKESYHYGICFAYKEIGNTYRRMKQSEYALDYYRSAKAELTYLYNKRQEPYIYSNMAYSFLAEGEFDSAWSYTILTEMVSKKDSVDHLIKARLPHLYAMIYYGKCDTLVAKGYLASCFEYCSAQDDYRTDLTYSLAALDYSKILRDHGKPQLAKQYSLLSFSIANKRRWKPAMIDAAKQLNIIYEELSHTDSAYYYSQLAINYTDTVYDQHLMSEIQNMAITQRIKEIEEAAHKKESEHNRKQKIGYAACAIVVVIVLMIFFLLSNTPVIGSKEIDLLGRISLLLTFEFINLLIHPSLVYWTNDSPLFILMALVILAAILVPSHHHIETWMVDKFKKMNHDVKDRFFKWLNKVAQRNVNL